MRHFLALVFIPMLAGCTSAAEEAEQRYAIVEEESFLDPTAKCRAAREVQAAWLAEGNAEKYQSWSVSVYNDCFDARRM